MKKTSIYNIFHFFNTLLVFFVILLRTCLTKCESIKLKCYFTTLLYTIVVNMLFLEFSSKEGFPFNYTFDAGYLKSIPWRNWKLLWSINQSNYRDDYFFICYFSKFYQKCFGLYHLDSKYDFFNAFRSIFIL